MGVVDCILTRHDIPSVHGVFILDESEAIHELDFRDLSCAMLSEVRLDVLLRGWEDGQLPRTVVRADDTGSIPFRGRFPK